MTPFTILQGGHAALGPAPVREEGVVLEPDAAWTALALPIEGEADLAELATRLDRPLAVDLEDDFTIRRGTMPMRGLDPMGPDFRAMLGEWTTARHRYYRPLET